jgi:hypothetical protein
VRTAVNGTEASVYRYGEDEADITVRFSRGRAPALEDLARLVVVNEDGDQVPLEAVATVRTDASLTSINHKDQKRVVTITGDVTSPELAEPVRAGGARSGSPRSNLLPPGYTVGFAGQSEDEEEAKAFLSKAFLYAVLVVLALMVAQVRLAGGAADHHHLGGDVDGRRAPRPAGHRPAVRHHHDRPGGHLARRHRGQQRDRAARLRRAAPRPPECAPARLLIVTGSAACARCC